MIHLAVAAALVAAAADADPREAVERLAQRVTERGKRLTAAEIEDLFDADYLKDGFGRAVGAAECATLLRGWGPASVAWRGEPVRDSHGDTARLSGTLVLGSARQRLQRRVEDDRRTLCSLRLVRRGEDGRWRFYGNRRIARASVDAAMVSRRWGGSVSSTTTRDLRLMVSAPPGTVRAVRARWWGREETLRRRTEVILEVFLKPAPDSLREVRTEHFSWEAGPGEEPPPAGTEIDFEVEPSSGPSAVYAETLAPWPQAPAVLLQPTGHSLKDARLGRTLKVEWRTPEFAVVEAELVAVLAVPGAVCEIDPDPPLLPESRTRALLRLPISCAGSRLLSRPHDGGAPPVFLTLMLTGADGRTAEVHHAFW